jgi:hypothetical protein
MRVVSDVKPENISELEVNLTLVNSNVLRLIKERYDADDSISTKLRCSSVEGNQ